MHTPNRPLRTVRRSPLAAACLALAGCALAASALPPPLPPVPTNRPAAKPVDAKPGQMTLIDREFDLGEFFDTEPQKMTYRFKSTGVNPLRIMGIKPECGCTLASLYRIEKDEAGNDKKVYLDINNAADWVFAPGQEGGIESTFNPENRSGPQNKAIRLTTNDMTLPEQRVSFKGTIIPLVKIDPPLVGFGEVPKSAGATKTIRVIGRTPDFAVPNISFDKPGLFTAKVLSTEEIVELGKPGRAVTIELTLSPGAKAGVAQDTMYVRTNDPRKPLVNVNVFGRIVGDILVDPARVTLGVINVGETRQQRITLKHRDGKPFEISEIDSGSSILDLKFTATPASETDRTTWTIDIDAKAISVAPRLTGIITVITNLADEGPIEIPLNASVRQGLTRATPGLGVPQGVVPQNDQPQLRPAPRPATQPAGQPSSQPAGTP
jgi:hypothetical protein